MQDLNLYHIFYEVALLGSFSAAANKLFISQPAISYNIATLENELKCKLFNRTSKGVTLTKEGEGLFDYVKQALGLLNNAEQKLMDDLENHVGELKIGASDTICKYFLLNKIENFHVLYPNINLKLSNSTTSESINKLKNGEVDIAFIHIPYSDEQLEIKEVYKLNDIFVCSNKFSNLIDNRVSIAKLNDYPLMLLEKQSHSRNFIDEQALKYGVILKPQIELASLDLLIEFAKCGLGITCVAKQYVLNELKEGKLKEIMIKEKLDSRGIGLVNLKKVPPSLSALKFTKNI